MKIYQSGTWECNLIFKAPHVYMLLCIHMIYIAIKINRITNILNIEPFKKCMKIYQSGTWECNLIFKAPHVYMLLCIHMIYIAIKINRITNILNIEPFKKLCMLVCVWGGNSQCMWVCVGGNLAMMCAKVVFTYSTRVSGPGIPHH